MIQSQTLYDDAGQAVGSIDELGHKSQTTYDAAGEAVASTIYDADANGNPVARTSTTSYDGDGRSVKSTDALGRTSIPTYDAGGRVTSATSYDRNGNALSTSSTHYDALGRVDYSTDAAGHVKRMSYDNLGRLSAVIQATQGTPSADGSGQYDLVTQFRYDEVGHKILQQDANGHITRFGYDIRGRMTWRALPMGGSPETMVYDAGGQLKQSTDFRGYATSYSYDDRGRLLAKVPDSRLQEAGLFYSYPDENTRTAARGNATTTQHYDPQRGWLNSVSGPNGSVSYAYNPEGQKVAMTSPSGTTGYGYDVLGRLSAINDQPSGATAATSIASYAYDAVGNLSTLTRGNGVVTRYAFDEQNRLSDLVNTSNAGDLSRFHYTLRADGKRTGINESLVDVPDATTGAARSSVRSLAYSYDNAGKLTGETGQDGLGVAYANSWNYDAVGNRTSATVQKAATAGATTWAHTTSVSAVFNANDQLTSSSSSVDGGTAQVQNTSYDQNGAEAGTSSASGSSTNGWNFEGKLTQTAFADASGQAAGGSANCFDAQGDRLSRVSDVGKTSQKTTNYLVDSDTSYAQVIEERAPDTSDAAGQPQLQARYVWGQGLAPLAMWRKTASGVKLVFHLADGQDSVRQLTDASGAVTDSYFYDAWGNALAGGAGTTENPFRYTGQQRDPDGRYYLRARFYNPGNGGFLSHDPLMGEDEDPTSLHRYLYAGADGVNACDPSGRDTLGEIVTSETIGQSLDALDSAAVQVAEKTITEKALEYASSKLLDACASTLMDFLAQCMRLSHEYGGADNIPWAHIDRSELAVSFASSFLPTRGNLYVRALTGGAYNVFTTYFVAKINAVFNPQGLPANEIKPLETSDYVINFTVGFIGAFAGEVGGDLSDEMKAGLIRGCKEDEAKMTEWTFTFMDQFLENIVTQGVSDSYNDCLSNNGITSHR